MLACSKLRGLRSEFDGWAMLWEKNSPDVLIRIRASPRMRFDENKAEGANQCRIPKGQIQSVGVRLSCFDGKGGGLSVNSFCLPGRREIASQDFETSVVEWYFNRRVRIRVVARA